MIGQDTATRRSRPRKPALLVSLAWLGLTALGATLAPLLAPHGPLAARPALAFLPPGAGAILGTDFIGRDVLARLLWGGRRTLQMGGLGLVVAVGLGLPLGVAAGSLGRRADAALMRLVDGLLALPGLLLAMMVTAVLGTGLMPVAVAVGLAAAPPYARMARGAALEVRRQPYIEATRALGSSRWRIIARHILPNAAPTLVAFAATQLGWVLLNGAALNFLGLGAPPGSPEWGAMLAEGRKYLREGPWASGFPGLALTLTVFAANLVGERLQETLRRG